MANCLKEFQSLSRGIRNGEFTTVMAGTGKSMILDMESRGIEPSFEPNNFRSWRYQHWCHDPQTDRWTYHRGRPFHEYIVGSDRILARKDDGTYYWYKNRDGDTMATLTDEELKELTFVFLGAEEVSREIKWIDIKTYRPIGNPCDEILLK